MRSKLSALTATLTWARRRPLCSGWERWKPSASFASSELAPPSSCESPPASCEVPPCSRSSPPGSEPAACASFCAPLVQFGAAVGQLLLPFVEPARLAFEPDRFVAGDRDRFDQPFGFARRAGQRGVARRRLLQLAAQLARPREAVAAQVAQQVAGGALDREGAELRFALAFGQLAGAVGQLLGRADRLFGPRGGPRQPPFDLPGAGFGPPGAGRQQPRPGGRLGQTRSAPGRPRSAAPPSLLRQPLQLRRVGFAFAGQQFVAAAAAAVRPGA